MSSIYERYYEERFRRQIQSTIGDFGKADIASVIPDESFLLFDKDRAPVRRALAGVVGSTLSHLDLTHALEVGSGTGELARLIKVAGMDPKVIVYSDIDIARLSKNLPEGTTSRQLDIADLIANPQSQTAIVSLNTLDLFPNERATLDQELSVIEVALASGGSLVHFEDLMPDEFALFKRYPDSIIIPAFNEGSIMELPFYLLSREEAEQFEQLLFKFGIENLGNFWKMYTHLDPIEKALTHRGAEPNPFPVLLKNLNILVKEKKLQKLKRMDLAKEFPRYMSDALGKLGFQTSASLVTKTFEGEPTENQKPGTVYRYAFSKLDTVEDRHLGDRVREIASVLVITAQKPK